MSAVTITILFITYGTIMLCYRRFPPPRLPPPRLPPVVALLLLRLLLDERDGLTLLLRLLLDDARDGLTLLRLLLDEREVLTLLPLLPLLLAGRDVLTLLRLLVTVVRLLVFMVVVARFPSTLRLFVRLFAGLSDTRLGVKFLVLSPFTTTLLPRLDTMLRRSFFLLVASYVPPYRSLSL